MSGINKYYYLEKKKRGKSTATEAPIADVLSSFMKANHIDYNPDETQVIQTFKQITGKMIENFVSDIRLKNNILYVKVSLPSVKAELFMVRDALKNNINKTLRKTVVNSIIIK
ncbi:MAG: DUF721 domain-containing protein [Bacteroidales bacterium]|nr:DUF721 domain-containing protein [Bacteroidales bacterium]